MDDNTLSETQLSQALPFNAGHVKAWYHTGGAGPMIKIITTLSVALLREFFILY